MSRFFISLFLIISIINTLDARDVPASGVGKSKLKKNSIYIENLVILPSINYERLIPLSKDDKMRIALKAGLTHYSRTFLTTEATFLFGGIKHSMEIGGGWAGKYMLGTYGRIGYRYSGSYGLLLKGGLLIVKNVPVFPSFGLGFSF